MRFALLGDHPDGLAMARALVDSSRHELGAYSGPGIGGEYLRRWGIAARGVGDLEEVLAERLAELHRRTAAARPPRARKSA